MSAILDYKLEIFIPPEFAAALAEALADAGVGRIGNYDHCLAMIEVRGFWRPLDGADPYLGTAGQVESAAEVKVEVNTTAERIPAALAAIRRVHPYEEPVINIIPLANRHFFTSAA